MKLVVLLFLLSGPLWPAGLSFSAFLSGNAGVTVTATAADRQGNIYVAGSTKSSDFSVTPGALQAQLNGPSDAFIAKFSTGGKLLWSTYYGGGQDESAKAIAVDSAGNVVVAGSTGSADFPLVNAYQSTLHNGLTAIGGDDGFVVKLDPTGTKVLYSTYLGSYASPASLAVDAAGNAYIAGGIAQADPHPFPVFNNFNGQLGTFVAKLNASGTFSYAYFYASNLSLTQGGGIAVDAAGSAYATVLSPDWVVTVIKLSPDGSVKMYEAGIGLGTPTAMAVDAAGSAYVAGATNSTAFPLVRPFQATMDARPLWRSTDAGATWTPLDNLPFANPYSLAVDPTASQTLYAGAIDGGVFKSVDGGAAWSQTNSGIDLTGGGVAAVAIDPTNPQRLFAGGNAGYFGAAVYLSRDGAATWTPVDPGISAYQLAIDPQNPQNVYSVGDDAVRKSADGGATWAPVMHGQATALDPRTSGNIWVYVPAGGFSYATQFPAALYHSTDGAADWYQIPNLVPSGPDLVLDGSTNPTTVYAGLTARSTDGGNSWAAITAPSSQGGAALAAFQGALYAAGRCGGLFVSNDKGQSWTATGSPVPAVASCGGPPLVTALVSGGAPGTLHAVVSNVQSSAFVTKLSPDGSNIVYSTFLSGHPSMAPLPLTTLFGGSQTEATAIALDPAGNIVVAGGTRSSDFPVVNPAQASNAGAADAFVAVISADGSRLNYSTYLGGSQDDYAAAVAVDPQGNVAIAGMTASSDFAGMTPPQSQYANGFVAKLVLPAPAISSVLNGASFQPGIEAGSWVTIQGSNLANTTRTWRSSDFVGDELPTSLDGVSVSIDGQPAFVEYISPTQINVQAPSDSVVGAVNVVVDNNGAVSAPGTAQLQAVAPAFFLYPGTNYALASRLPDYALVGTSLTAPAKPGDILVLWGTGFGATDPPVLAGTVVSGAPAAVIAPTVTVGGVDVPVLGTVLTPGTAGLYQVTIQLPANVPTGAVAVQASAGGVQTQAGVTIFVGKS